VYAEDPDNNYFPSPGEITALKEPSGPGIRVDGGIYQGWTVPVEYDPLLAKLVAYGETREQAIGRLKRALAEYFIGGIRTNLSLFERILSNVDFVAGKTDTAFLARLPQASSVSAKGDDELAAIAAGIFYALEKDHGQIPDRQTSSGKPSSSHWVSAARIESLR
jgi:acetyl-CoA carboxylase biotin carboxylase subunit